MTREGRDFESLLEQVPSEIREPLREYPNVVGHAIGREITGGDYTGDLSVIVYVSEKVPEEDLDPEQVIPEEVEGVKTDIQEVPESPKPPLTGDPESYEPRGNRGEEVLPWSGGVEIEGEGGGPSGTGGSGVLECNGDTGFLSNYHVVCEGEDSCIGEEIYHPADGVQVGEVTELGQWDPDGDGEDNLDFAFVSLEEVDSTDRLYGLGTHAGFTEPNFQQRYTKTGARTGFTSGLLEARDVTISVQFEDTEVEVSGADKYLTQVYPGDSGGIIGEFDSDTGEFYMTGLVFAFYEAGEVHPLSEAYYAHPVSDIEDRGFSLDLYDGEEVITDPPDGGEGEPFVEVAHTQVIEDTERDVVEVHGIASQTGGTSEDPVNPEVTLLDRFDSEVDSAVVEEIASGEWSSFVLEIDSSDVESEFDFSLESDDDTDLILMDEIEVYPDLEVIEAPEEVMVGETIDLLLQITSNYEDTTLEDVVTLEVDGQVVDSEDIEVEPEESEEVVLSYTPFPMLSSEGVTMEAHTHSSETTVDVDVAVPDGDYLYLYEWDGDKVTNAHLQEELKSINPVREHTAISDWQATVPYDLDLEDWVLEQVFIYDGDSFVFHGFLEQVQSDESAAETTLSGRGVGKELVDQESTYQFEDTETWKAIKEVSEDLDGWDWEVLEPEDGGLEETLEVLNFESPSDWESVDIPESLPWGVGDDGMDVKRTGYWLEAQDGTFPGETEDDNEASGGEVYAFSSRSSQWFGTWTTEYNTGQSDGTIFLDWRFYLPETSGEYWGVDIIVDGQLVDGYANGWTDDQGWVYGETAISNIDVTPGESVQVSIEPGEDDGEEYDTFLFDFMTITDTQYNNRFAPPPEDFDSDTLTFPYPEAYPERTDLPLEDVETTINITEAEITSTWDSIVDPADYDGEEPGVQALGLSIDSGETFEEETYTETFTLDLTEEPTVSIKPRLTGGRLTVEQDEPVSPTEGNAGQTVEEFTLTIEGDGLSIIADQEFSGDYLKIMQDLHEFAGMRFTINHREDGRREALSYQKTQIEREKTWEVKNRTRDIDVRNFKNRVVVEGAKRDDGTRYRGEAKRESSIESIGEYSLSITDPSLESDDDCEAKARTILLERIEEGELSGSHEITPSLVDPGPLYYLPEWDKYVAAERVSYSKQFGEFTGTIDFSDFERLAGEITSLKASTTDLGGLI